MLIHSGWLWVSFFFVLSGFVMMFAYSNALKSWSAKAYYRFVISRFGRIYPLFAFTIAVLLVLRISGIADGRDEWWTLPPTLFLLQGFIFGEPGWNVPAWSISTEWAVYLVFPLFVPFLAALGRRTTFFCTAAFAIAVAWLFIADVNAKNLPIERLVGCGLEFALGCCVFQLVKNLWWPELNYWVASLLCILPVLLMMLPSRFFHTVTTASIAVSFAVSIAVMSRQDNALQQMLRHNTLQFLGRISYSLYLNHAILYLVAAIIFEAIVGSTLMNQSGRVAIPLFAVYCLALVVFSKLTYKWVEEPSRLWFKNLARSVNLQNDNGQLT